MGSPGAHFGSKLGSTKGLSFEWAVVVPAKWTSLEYAELANGITGRQLAHICL